MDDIRRENQAVLSEYASISVEFEIRETLDLASIDPRTAALPTRAVTPRIKDYDAIPHNGPRSWATRRDISSWVFLVSRVENKPVGGAIVVTEPSAVIELGGRAGNGLLWDLRVAPEWRRRGLGRALIAAAEQIARGAGARGVDIETQDTNVPACRLYLACGYILREIQPNAYEPLTGEAKLLWTKAML